jgi:hypothetical protein
MEANGIRGLNGAVLAASFVAGGTDIGLIGFNNGTKGGVTGQHTFLVNDAWLFLFFSFSLGRRLFFGFGSFLCGSRFFLGSSLFLSRGRGRRFLGWSGGSTGSNKQGRYQDQGYQK